MFRFRRPVAEILRRLDPRSSDGIAAIEMAFVAPILVMMLVGIWDFGRFAYENARLTSAAGAGAQLLFSMGADTDITNPADVAAMEQAVRDDARDINNILSITPSQFCECPGNVPVACNLTCGAPPELPAKYIGVLVSGSVKLLLDYNFATNPYPIVKQTVVRVQ